MTKAEGLAQQVRAEENPETFDMRLKLLALKTEIRILISIECDLKERRLRLMKSSDTLQERLDGQQSLFG